MRDRQPLQFVLKSNNKIDARTHDTVKYPVGKSVVIVDMCCTVMSYRGYVSEDGTFIPKRAHTGTRSHKTELNQRNILSKSTVAWILET